MEDIPEIGSSDFGLPLDVDDDLLEVLLDVDNTEIPEPPAPVEVNNKNNVIKLSATSSMPVPQVKQEYVETENTSLPVKPDPESEEITSTDPNEIKKQRRLIRNRMSAQLHRERKKAYIDKLEAEVKQRDNTITLLGLRINDLETENAKLRQLVSEYGVGDKVNISSPEIDSFDLGFTTHEESCDSDTSDDKINQLSKKRSSTSDDPMKKKSAKIGPGTLLASLACLFLFRSSFFDFGFNKVENQLAPIMKSDPVRHGRVLFSVEEPETEEETQTESFSDPAYPLVMSSTPQRIQLNNQPPSVPKPDKDTIEATNKTYFFCPTKFQSSTGVASGWPSSLNKTESDNTHNSQRTAKRRLRARANSSSVPSIPRDQFPQRSTPIKLIKSESDNELAKGSLVLRDSKQKSQSEQPHYEEEADDKSRQLTLVVPSASLDGYNGFSSDDAPSNWMEIDCQMRSARFIDFN